VVLYYHSLLKDAGFETEKDSGDYKIEVTPELVSRYESAVKGGTKGPPAGTSTDKTGGRNEPATVYGSKEGGYIVVKESTRPVVQVSNRTPGSGGIPDSRINWGK
jgi:hypothetical protein